MKVKYEEVLPWWLKLFGWRPTVHEVEMTPTKNTIKYKLDGEVVDTLKPEVYGIRFVTATKQPVLNVTAMEILTTLFPVDKKLPSYLVETLKAPNHQNN